LHVNNPSLRVQHLVASHVTGRLHKLQPKVALKEDGSAALRDQVRVRAKMMAPGTASCGLMTSSASIVNPASRNQLITVSGWRR
jgi:hypothetical protein